MEEQGLFELPLYGGTVRDWLVALGLAAVLFFSAALLKPVAVRRLAALAQRTHTRIDDLAVEVLQSTRLALIAVLALAAGAQYLELSEKASTFIAGASTVALFLQMGLWGAALLRQWMDRARARALETNVSAATGLSALGFIAQVVLWAIIALLALDNLGINVTALVAGLGVGGIAIALAVQNILGDLFASLSIVVDKPFVIGDFIIVDDYMGTVENVGLKTTRIRSLGGEQIIFSNSDLLKTRVRNYKRMFQRRCVFSIGVVYGTPLGKLEKIPGIAKRSIESQQKVRFDRAHFQKYGDWSLVFEVVYWVLDPDYNLFMDIQQAVNLSIMRDFAKEGIEFAFPTQVVHVQGVGAAPQPAQQREPASS